MKINRHEQKNYIFDIQLLIYVNNIWLGLSTQPRFISIKPFYSLQTGQQERLVCSDVHVLADARSKC